MRPLLAKLTIIVYIVICQEVAAMSLEAVRLICGAEEEARQAKFLALKSARESIEEAQRAGEDAVARSLALAETEVAHLIRACDKKATEQARELASKTANRQATLRARAERRLDDTVKLIIERIVKS